MAPGVTTSSWTTCSYPLTVRARSSGGEQLTACPAAHYSDDGRWDWCPVPGHGARGNGPHDRDTAQQGICRSLGASIRERPSVLADIASYSAAVAAAGSHLHMSMAAMWDKVRHQLPTAEDRAALYSAGLYAATVARAGVVAMHAAAGTTALYVDCPLERSIRDLQTMERHIAAQSIWLEDVGRVLVGHEPINPLFMI